MSKLLKWGLMSLVVSVAGFTVKEIGDYRRAQSTGPVAIGVGESHNFGFVNVSYRGMNGEDSFSLSGTSRSSVNNYYPADSDRITFQGYPLSVESVDPEEIRLRYLGKK